MKRKLLLFALTTFLVFGLAGCDLLSMLMGITTTVATTTVETTDTGSTDTTVETTATTTITTEGTTTTLPETTVTTASTSAVTQYTVTFYDENGTTVLKTEIVNAGANATPPANPTKASTAMYSYTFFGWDVPYTNVTSNLSVKAVYTPALRTYTVAFFDEDGTTVLNTQVVNAGTNATPPANPTKADTAQWDYTFAGWDIAYTNVLANLVVKATYNAVLRQYTVTFYNDDGTTVLGSSTVAYGTAAVAPATTPTKPSTDQYVYTFTGWSAAFSNVQSSFAVNAVYSQAIRQYTVTFYDDDGTTVLGTSTVNYGTAAAAPANPTKPSTAQYTFTFNGWGGSYANVQSALSINATYVSTLRYYTVSFYNANGALIDTQSVAYGDGATAPASPTLASTAQYDYAFTGWDKTFDPIGGALTVNAVFAATTRQYAVTFYDEDGFTVLGTSTVDYGTAAVAPADPTKPATLEATYTFSHWDGDYDDVRGDASVFAVYAEVRTAYHVAFVDIDGTILQEGLIPAGADAVPPADPSRPATAQYTYTFTGWNGGFSAVDSDREILATYDVVVSTFTVTFYNEDGIELLGESTVEYGHPAVPPVSPTKTDWYFLGWSQGVAYVTRDMIVTAVFSNIVWNRQLLLDYLAGWHDGTPSPEELEADVTFLLGLLNTDSEQYAYELTQVFEGFVENVMMADTLAELQEAYTNAKASGFNRERIIGILMTVANQGLAEGIANGRYEQLLQRIAMLEQQILNTEAMKPVIIQQGIDYCNDVAGIYQSECWIAWTILVEETNRYMAYNEAYDVLALMINANGWSWNGWYAVQGYLDLILYYTYADDSEWYRDYYQDAYDAAVAQLSPDERAAYDAVLILFSNWKSYQYADGNLARETTAMIDDIYGYNIGESLTHQMSDYEELFWTINNFEEDILQCESQFEDALAEREFLIAIQAYLATEEGAAKAELLAGTFYDMLESVLYGVDEGTFDLIYGLATGTIDPATLDMTAAGLLGYVDQSTVLIRLFLSTVDGGDTNNLKSILKDFIGLYVGTQDLTEEERAELILFFGGIVDEYAQIAHDVYVEMLDLLDSLDEEKIQIILDQLAILQGSIFGPTAIGTYKTEEGFDFPQMVAVAKVIDALAYESGVDVDLLLGYFVRVYYDVYYEFIYDDAERLAVTAALTDSVQRILELVHLVAGFDATAIPSPAQLQLLYELQIRVQRIGQAFSWGWPALMLDDDYSIYSHDMFFNLIYQMNPQGITEEMAEAEIAMLVATFELSEQDTYFLLLSFMNAFRTIGRNPSITAVADLYFGLAAMGYDNAAIAHYLTNFAVNMIDFQLLYSRTDEDIAKFQAWIDEYTVYIHDLSDAYDSELAAFYTEIALQPDQAVREAALALFDSHRENDELWMIHQQVYNATRFADSYYNVWEDHIYNQLTMYCGWIAEHSAPNHFDEYLLAEDVAAYELIWASLTTEEQSMYLGPINAYDIWAHQYWNSLQYDVEYMWTNYGEVYISDGYTLLVDFVQETADDLFNIGNQIVTYQQQIAQWTNQINDLEAHGDQELLMFQTFFAEPESRQLVEDSILILLDEAANLLATADLETIDLFIGVMSKSLDPSMIDLSAAGILGYTQSLSTIIKTLGETITDAEFDTLILLAMKGLYLAVGSQEGMTEEEKLALLAQIETMIEKYVLIGFATRTVITDFLDSLTEEKIQLVLDQLAILGINFGGGIVVVPIVTYGVEGGGEPGRGPSEIEMAIAIAKIVDVLLYDGSLDTDTLIATAIEIYYDFAMGGTYDPAVKALVLAAYQSYIDELIMLAHELAGADPAMLSPDDVALLMELRQRLEFLMGLFESGNIEGILEPIDFGYERWMFVDLLRNFDWKTDWDDEPVQDAAIAAITQVFDSSEEQAYYNLVAIMNVAMAAIENGSPEDILAALDMLASIGFTDADIAEYLGNFPLAALTFQQFMIDYYEGDNEYADDLLLAQENLAAALLAVADLAFQIETQIAAVIDPAARAVAQTYWEMTQAKMTAYYAYQTALETAAKNPLWNYDIYWYDLEINLETAIFWVSNEAYDIPTSTSHRNELNAYFAALSADEQAMYGPVLALYETYYTLLVNDYSLAYDEFDHYQYNHVAGADFDRYFAISDLLFAYSYACGDVFDDQNEVAMWQALYDSVPTPDFTWLITFFADPANAVLFDQIAVIGVDEIDNLLTNFSPELIGLIGGFSEFMKVNGQLSDYQQQMQNCQNQIMNINALAYEIFARISNPDAALAAQRYYETSVVSTDLWHVYIDELDARWYDPTFESWYYFYVQDILSDAIVNESPNYFDTYWAGYYRSQYEIELAAMTPEQYALYFPILDLYSTWMTYDFNEHALAGNDFNYYSAFVDPAESWIYWHVDSLAWAYQDAVEQIEWLEDEIPYWQTELEGTLPLTPAAIAGYAQTVASYLGIVFDTVSTEDEAVLAAFFHNFFEAYLVQSGYYTEAEIIDLMAAFDGAFEFYLDALLYAPDMASLVLANLTDVEIQTIMDQIGIINALPGIDPDQDNMVRAVAIANLVLAVAGDGYVDTDYIVETMVRFYFDDTYDFQYDGEIVIADRILLLQALIDDILLQADVIDGFDPYALTEEQRGEINEFHLLVEDMIDYMNYGLDYEPIV